MPKSKFTIKGPADKLLKKLEKSGRTTEDLRQFVTKKFKLFAHLAAGHVIKTQLSGGIVPAFQGTSGAGAKQRKKRQSGSMARSVSGAATKYDGAPAIEVGILRARNSAVLSYSWTQEYGTKGLNPESPVPDIKPKGNGLLAVPGDLAKYPTGEPRYDGPRDYPDILSPIYFNSNRGKNGNVAGVLVLQSELEAVRGIAISTGSMPDYMSLEAIYYLLTIVKVRPGFYLTDGMQDYLPILSFELAKSIMKDFLGKNK